VGDVLGQCQRLVTERRGLVGILKQPINLCGYEVSADTGIVPAIKQEVGACRSGLENRRCRGRVTGDVTLTCGPGKAVLAEATG
jgi:hypothetical protein